MSDKSGPEQYSLEQEGQIARLLRDLSLNEAEAERRPIVSRLRELTEHDFGTHPGRWLLWYLEEHLGLRNAVEILHGKVTDERDGGEGALRMDEQVFERPEYNWCALERIKNKDDMLKLKMLYSDLESPIQPDVEGPLSFRRLTGLDAADLRYFATRSISQAIFSDEVEVRHLRILKDYGKMMMMPLFPSATQRAGAIIYASSISQALVRFDSKITSLAFKDLAESLPGLIERPYVVESYAKLFRAALEKCR